MSAWDLARRLAHRRATRAITTAALANPWVALVAAIALLLAGVTAISTVGIAYALATADELACPTPADRSTLRPGTVTATTTYVPGDGSAPNTTVVAIAHEVAAAKGASPRATDALFRATWVESGFRVLANYKVPESFDIAHDPYPEDRGPLKAGNDGYSVGALQGQTIYADEWGTVAQIMDPAHAFSLFLDKAAELEANGFTGSAAEMAQTIQASAHPQRYEDAGPKAAELRALAPSLTGTTTPTTATDTTAATTEPCGGGPESGAFVLPVEGLPPPPQPFTGQDGGCILRDPTATGGCVTPRTAWAIQQITEAFGGWPAGVACWDEHAWNPTSDHPKGQACDYTVGQLGRFPTPAEKPAGDVLAEWLRTYADALGVSYIIWDGKQWHASRSDKGWYPYGGGGVYDATDPTGGHYEHVHLSMRK